MTYNKNIKPKRTLYRGVEFDSRLEARVAEAYDVLGIEWEYHTKAFQGKGFVFGRYTPDLWLPGEGLHVEVCWRVDDKHRRQVEAAVTHGGASGLLDGDPAAPGIVVVTGDDHDGAFGLRTFVTRCPTCGRWGHRYEPGKWVCRSCGAIGEPSVGTMCRNLFKAAGVTCYEKGAASSTYSISCPATDRPVE